MVCDAHKDSGLESLHSRSHYTPGVTTLLESLHSLSSCTGVYISKTSYVRPGERSLDGFYKAYHTVGSFPGLPRFFVLRFAFSIIHGSVYYIELQTEGKKNGVGLGTRLG